MHSRTLDLRPDHLATVRSILAHHIPNRRVYAFGSRVKGTARKQSDLDLVIMGTTAVPTHVLEALRDAFGESNLPMKVDVIDWATTADNFRTIIEEQTMLIQEGEGK